MLWSSFILTIYLFIHLWPGGDDIEWSASFIPYPPTNDKGGSKWHKIGRHFCAEGINIGNPHISNPLESYTLGWRCDGIQSKHVCKGCFKSLSRSTRFYPILFWASILHWPKPWNVGIKTHSGQSVVTLPTLSFSELHPQSPIFNNFNSKVWCSTTCEKVAT